MGSRRREQFLPGADGSIRFAGRKVDVRSLAQELSMFPDLQHAVAENDVTRTKSILQAQIESDRKELLDMADKDGFRLIHRACALGSVELMSLLLENGADPNAKDNCGDTPMHWACFSGNLDAAECLLRAGGDPLLASSDGKTPLGAALEEKHTHILQLLFSRPWNVYDSRAILEAVLQRGSIRIKVQSRFVNNRRIWRVQHTVISSMLRAVFIYRTKEMTDSAEDCEHICFHDLLMVRWQMDTRKRYMGRRFNVYALVENPGSLKFNFTSSGLDDSSAGDFTVGGGPGDDAVVEEDEAASDTGSEIKRGFVGKVLASFRRTRKADASEPESAKTSAVNGGSSYTSGDCERTKRAVCIAFLADSQKEAKRWMDAFKYAGEQGKTMCCVRIQTVWRGFRCRMQLKRLQVMQIDGSALVSRRGTKSSSSRTISLDASRIVHPPPQVSTALVQTRRGSVVQQFLAGASKKSKTTAGYRSQSSNVSGGRSFEMPASIAGRKTTALALPVEQPISTAEDISGYLKKRSETGVSGALRLWKNRYVILSHSAAQVQYFDPRRKPHKIHRVPFSTMLSVKPIEKDKDNLTFVLRVVGGDQYRFEAQDRADRDRWIGALMKVLPRENVAALLIQRVTRGHLDRKRVKQLRLLALQRAMRKRDEALIRIEEARQRAASEIEARSKLEELVLLERLQNEEKEFKRRLKAAKRKAQQEALLTESPLPEPWQQFTDKKSGRAYYYNRITKVTTWHRPKAAIDEATQGEESKLSEGSQMEIDSSKLNETEGNDRLSESKAWEAQENSRKVSRKQSPKKPELPPNWRELVDPSSGETYYFNSVTQESTWTRPSNGTQQSPWSKRYDANSGHYYYYDEKTGKSQWEPPEEFKETDENEPGETMQAEEVETTATDPIPEQQRSSLRRDDATEQPTSRHVSGKAEFASATSVATQKKRTASQKLEEDLGNEEDDGEEVVARVQSMSKADRARMASGRSDSGASPTTQTMKTLQKALEKTTLKRTRADDWQKFTDPKSGAPYYVNASTGEKTWTKPAVLGGPKSKKEAWIALKDNEGREYFNNSVTGESVWELPPGERLASSIESPETDSEIVAAFTRHIDVLMAQFPQRRNDRGDDDNSSEDSEVVEQEAWAMLDEEDDPVHYVPLHEKGGLFEAVRSGLVLCRLINRIEPETIDPRAMNIDVDTLASVASTSEEREHVLRLASENHALFLGAVRSLGGQIPDACTPELLMGREFMNPDASSIVGMEGAEAEEQERRRIILDVLWEVLQIDLLEPVNIVTCRPLLNLMDSSQREPYETVMEFDALHESEKLLRWLRYHAPSIQCRLGGTNSAVFVAAALCCALWAVKDRSQLPQPSLPPQAHRVVHDPTHALGDEDKVELFEQLAFACQSLGIRLYANRPECLGADDARLQLACCAAVFAEHHNLPTDVKLTEEEQNELKALSMESDLDESRDERILRTWINSLNIKLRPGSSAPSASLSPRGRSSSSSTSSSSSSKTILRVKNLFLDLRDGVVLLHVFQAVRPSLNVFENYNKVHLRPENKFHMLENASVIIDLAKAGLNLSIVNLGPFDIVDGNRKLILGLTWQIMRFASLALLDSVDTSNFIRWKASPEAPVTEQDVLNWANDKVRFANLQKQTSFRSSVKFVERPLVVTEVSLKQAATAEEEEGSSNVDDGARHLTKRSSLRSSLKRSSVELVTEVASFKDQSLRNGCFLLALVNAVRPGTVNWKHAVPASFIDMNRDEGLIACERNAKYVVSLAFKLGCSVFLSWEDIVEVKGRALFLFVAGLIVYDAKQSSGSLSRSPSSSSPSPVLLNPPPIVGALRRSSSGLGE